MIAVKALDAAGRIGGYQLFLRFPAAYFTPVSFEPAAVDTSVFPDGPAHLAVGFDTCSGPGGDEWSDGEGEDVAAVAAGAERGRAVASSRSKKRPPRRRAKSKLKRAVRAPPICRYPVGEGANRVTTG